MRSIPHARWPKLAAFALIIGFGGSVVEAQQYGADTAAGATGDAALANPRAGQSLLGRFGKKTKAKYPTGVRQVQATGDDAPPPPPPPPPPPGTTPAQPAQGPAATAGQPEQPSANTPPTNETDLSIPRAEKEGGGGEPSTATAAEEKKEEPPKDGTKLLMKALGMEDSPYKIYGWIQNSYTGNTNGNPKSGTNFGVNPNNLANQWMGNQYYLIFEKNVEQNDKINFGYRVDNLFGNDWQFNHMHGLFDTSFRTNHFAGYDPAQMYGEVHLPFLTKGGIDVKGGRWYTLAGYEVVPATGRPLLSVPYMFNYGQPFTHLGAVSTWHLTDKINIYNGTINGWDRWVNSTYKWGYIGGINWTSKSGKTTVTTIVVAGPNQFPRFLPANTQLVPTGATPPPFRAGQVNHGYAGNNRTLVTTVITHKWTDKLDQVFETDQAIEDSVPNLGPNGTSHNAEWYSLGNWFLYKFNDKLTGVYRAEVFRDNNGIRTGFADNFYEQTVGLIYKPKSWIWIRPEARYDWAQFKKPFNDGTRGSQFTIGFDVILLF